MRVVPTGQEGWIYGELLQEVATSQLGEGEATVGLGDLFAVISTYCSIRSASGSATPMIAEVSEERRCALTLDGDRSPGSGQARPTRI